jgi:hypothetical protein
MIWLLQLLPQSVLYIIIHAAIAVGVVGLLVASFLKLVPFINIYRIWIQLICVVLLVAGIYWKGAYEVEMTWRRRVEELEKQVQESEARAEKINTKIVKQIRTKIQKHTVYRDRVRTEIQEKKVYIDQDCKLNPTAVELYNRAVTGEEKK